MKGQSEIANMPKFNNNNIIGNIDVGLGKFCRNDTLFL